MSVIFNKNTVLRIICIAVISLIIGIAVNQIHPLGIRLHVLVAGFSGHSSLQGWRPISADSSFVHYLQDSAYFVDIRPRKEYQLDHLKGALSIPFYDFMIHPETFNLPEKKSLLILYDFPPLSPKAPIMIKQLTRRGYENVFFLRNGYAKWLEYGFPIQKGEGS